VPFGIPQYVKCVLHGLTSVLLCVPFIFAKSVDLVVARDDFLCMHNGNCLYFHSGYLDYRGAFRLDLDFLVCSKLKIVEKEA